MLSALGGSLIGGLLSFLGAVSGQWMTSRREVRAKHLDVAEHRKRQREEFQLKTLLDLQDAAKRYSVSGAEIHAEVTKAIKSRPRDPAAFDKFSDQHIDAFAQMVVLTARVQDDRVRELSEIMRHEGRRPFGAFKNTDEPTEQPYDTKAVGRAFRELNDRIGLVIRDLY